MLLSQGAVVVGGSVSQASMLESVFDGQDSLISTLNAWCLLLATVRYAS